jgi:hypothetical protein
MAETPAQKISFPFPKAECPSSEKDMFSPVKSASPFSPGAIFSNVTVIKLKEQPHR